MLTFRPGTERHLRDAMDLIARRQLTGVPFPAQQPVQLGLRFLEDRLCALVIEAASNARGPESFQASRSKKAMRITLKK